MFLINKTADYIKEVKQTTNQQMWLEVALIDLSNLTNNTKLYELQARLDALESGGVAVSRQVHAVKPTVVPVAKPAVQNVQLQKQDIALSASTDFASNEQQENSINVETSVPQNNANSGQPVSTGANDIKSLWIQILKSIDGHADKALLQLANPVEISEERVILTFKAPIWVEKSSTPEKKKVLSDALALVLGKSDIPITIRQPLPDDKKMEKVVIPQAKKSEVPPKSLIEDEDVSEQELDAVNSQKQVKGNAEKQDNSEHSDQSNMVKQLFDGRFLDGNTSNVSSDDYIEDEE